MENIQKKKQRKTINSDLLGTKREKTIIIIIRIIIIINKNNNYVNEESPIVYIILYESGVIHNKMMIREDTN